MFNTIAIIGTGNIGAWLLKTLQNQSNISIISVSGRKVKEMPDDFDLYIFALKDDVYEDVLKQIPFKMSQALHTSGSLSQNILAPYSDNFGVIYPYQTITHNKEIIRLDEKIINLPPHIIPICQDSLPLVPICVEGYEPDFENILFLWANSVFSTAYKISEKQRFAMHLAAVFANNFTNAMYGIAYQIFQENNLDWSLIFPLLENTLEKAKQNKPKTVQTGPAARNDISIMKKHCMALSEENLRSLYTLISKIIHESMSLK